MPPKKLLHVAATVKVSVHTTVIVPSRSSVVCWWVWLVQACTEHGGKLMLDWGHSNCRSPAGLEHESDNDDRQPSCRQLLQMYLAVAAAVHTLA